MIAYLRGKIIIKDVNFIIINAGNVGYKVFINPAFLSELCDEADVEIFTHQHVREDALELYGFRNLAELEIFELLISVSGIGPKTALGVLSAGSLDDIKDSIMQQDAYLLTKVSGIGKKIAERVILELREKVGKISSSRISQEKSMISDLSDEIDALVALGYSAGEARQALIKVKSDIADSSERIKEALKGLSR
jgi:Holliday junction DNA helicase RuvA